MNETRGKYTPRSVDRALFATLGVSFVLAGAYLVGPWYISDTIEGQAPLLHVLVNTWMVIVYGALLLIDGLALIYASAGRGVYYTKIVAGALLAGFLLRLYSFIGVILTLKSWEPPSYLSHGVTVLLCGVMWVWIKISERPIQ